MTQAVCRLGGRGQAMSASTGGAYRCCKVVGCTVDLDTLGKAYRKKRGVCPEHIKAEVVQCKGCDDQLWRFCQQCGKLEPLARFEGDKRSCRISLAKRRGREESSSATSRRASKKSKQQQQQQQPHDQQKTVTEIAVHAGNTSTDAVSERSAKGIQGSVKSADSNTKLVDDFVAAVSQDGVALAESCWQQQQQSAVYLQSPANLGPTAAPAAPAAARISPADPAAHGSEDDDEMIEYLLQQEIETFLIANCPQQQQQHPQQQQHTLPQQQQQQHTLPQQQQNNRPEFNPVPNTELDRAISIEQILEEELSVVANNIAAGLTCCNPAAAAAAGPGVTHTPSWQQQQLAALAAANFAAADQILNYDGPQDMVDCGISRADKMRMLQAGLVEVQQMLMRLQQLRMQNNMQQGC